MFQSLLKRFNDTLLIYSAPVEYRTILRAHLNPDKRFFQGNMMYCRKGPGISGQDGAKYVQGFCYERFSGQGEWIKVGDFEVMVGGHVRKV